MEKIHKSRSYVLVGNSAIGGGSWGYHGSAHGYTHTYIYNTMVKVKYRP